MVINEFWVLMNIIELICERELKVKELNECVYKNVILKVFSYFSLNILPSVNFTAQYRTLS
jgi:hypothetical protein